MHRQHSYMTNVSSTLLPDNSDHVECEFLFSNKPVINFPTQTWVMVGLQALNVRDNWGSDS